MKGIKMKFLTFLILAFPIVAAAQNWGEEINSFGGRTTGSGRSSGAGLAPGQSRGSGSSSGLRATNHYPGSLGGVIGGGAGGLPYGTGDDGSGSCPQPEEGTPATGDCCISNSKNPMCVFEASGACPSGYSEDVEGLCDQECAGPASPPKLDVYVKDSAKASTDYNAYIEPDCSDENKGEVFCENVLCSPENTQLLLKAEFNVGNSSFRNWEGCTSVSGRNCTVSCKNPPSRVTAFYEKYTAPPPPPPPSGGGNNPPTGGGTSTEGCYCKGTSGACFKRVTQCLTGETLCTDSRNASWCQSPTPPGGGSGGGGTSCSLQTGCCPDSGGVWRSNTPLVGSGGYCQCPNSFVTPNPNQCGGSNGGGGGTQMCCGGPSGRENICRTPIQGSGGHLCNSSPAKVCYVQESQCY